MKKKKNYFPNKFNKKYTAKSKYLSNISIKYQANSKIFVTLMPRHTYWQIPKTFISTESLHLPFPELNFEWLQKSYTKLIELTFISLSNKIS